MVSGPDAARHRGVRRRPLPHRRRMDVADQRVAVPAEPRQPLLIVSEEIAHRLFALGAVHPHVHDDRALADGVRPHHRRPADRGAEDVGLAADSGEVAGPRVTERDRGVLMEEEQRERLAHDVASPDDHRAGSLDRNLLTAEHLHDSRRGTGARARKAGHQAAHVLGMEAVHVLVRTNPGQEFRRVEPVRERELQQDRIHRFVPVQPLQQTGQLGSRRRRGEAMGLGGDPGLPRGLDLAPHVDRRGGVVAHEHDRQSRRPSRAREFASRFGGVRPNRGADLLSVQDPSGHQSLLRFSLFTQSLSVPPAGARPRPGAPAPCPRSRAATRRTPPKPPRRRRPRRRGPSGSASG